MSEPSTNQWSLAAPRQRVLMAVGALLAVSGFSGCIAQPHAALWPLLATVGLPVELLTQRRVRLAAAADQRRQRERDRGA